MTHFAEAGKEISAHDALADAREQITTLSKRVSRLEKTVRQLEQQQAELRQQAGASARQSWMQRVFGGKESRQSATSGRNQ